MRQIPFLLLLVALFLNATHLPSAQRLEVEVRNIVAQKGCIRLAVFASEADFKAGANPVFTSYQRPTKALVPIRFQLKTLPQGRYAVAIFQDYNDNGKLDRNLFGIPQEPYAFSQEPESKWRAPSWEEISVDLPLAKPLKVDLKTWKER